MPISARARSLCGAKWKSLRKPWNFVSTNALVYANTNVLRRKMEKFLQTVEFCFNERVGLRKHGRFAAQNEKVCVGKSILRRKMESFARERTFCVAKCECFSDSPRWRTLRWTEWVSVGASHRSLPRFRRPTVSTARFD
jgi:hypothetical protein